MNIPNYVEVLIVGSGPAGSTTSIVLSQKGRSNIIIDESAYCSHEIGESLPPAVNKILKKLRLFDLFLHEGFLNCYGNMSAWGSSTINTINYTFDIDGNGWHIDRNKFNRFLRKSALSAGSSILDNTRIIKMKKNNKRWIVSLDMNGNIIKITCDRIIDASGRRSTIAQRYGAIRVRDDNLIAFFARFAPKHRNDKDMRTLIESVPMGWWYTSLIPSGERVVAFLTDADLINKDELILNDGFINALKQTIHIFRTIGTTSQLVNNQVYSTNANSAYLTHFADSDWLAIGDAAMSFDPLSSQGILNAMYIGIKGAIATDEHLSGREDSFERYCSSLNDIYKMYKKNRSKFYNYEKRWPEQRFWNRRRI